MGYKGSEISRRNIQSQARKWKYGSVPHCFQIRDIASLLPTITTIQLFTYIGANQDALAVAKGMGIDHSMNFTSSADGTKAMFMKEQRSRTAFYNKLARGVSFSKAMSEGDYFVDDDQDVENGF